MALYTATLSAQNTNTYVCDIIKPRGADKWFATVTIGGTFGTGTVTLQISFDNGITRFPIHYDGTATDAAVTAAAAINISSGWSATQTTQAKLYASIGAATTPSINITVVDNR